MLIPLLFHKTLSAFGVSLGRNWKYTDLCACSQQLFTKALTCAEHKNRHHDKLSLRKRPGKSPAFQAVNPEMSQWPKYAPSSPSGWIREHSGFCKGKFIKVQDSECPGHIYRPHSSQSETHLERHMLWGEGLANATNDKLESWRPEWQK